MSLARSSRRVLALLDLKKVIEWWESQQEWTSEEEVQTKAHFNKFASCERI